MPGAKNKPTNNNTFYRVITATILGLTILFIFYNSSKTGVSSGVISQNITIAISGNPVVEEDSLLETIVRKAGHIAEYAILGAALYACLQAFSISGRPPYGWILFSGVMVALADESYQLTIEGRAGQLTDIWIDLAGILLGIGLVRLILFIKHRSIKKTAP